MLSPVSPLSPVFPLSIVNASGLLSSERGLSVRPSQYCTKPSPQTSATTVPHTTSQNTRPRNGRAITNRDETKKRNPQTRTLSKDGKLAGWYDNVANRRRRAKTLDIHTQTPTHTRKRRAAAIQRTANAKKETPTTGTGMGERESKRADPIQLNGPPRWTLDVGH